MGRLIFVLMLPAAALAADLFRDDFSRFPPGLLSQPMGQLNGAIQEYHYIEHRGVRTHPWRNPIVHLDSWAGQRRGRQAVSRAAPGERLDTGRTTPLFVTGDEEWGDYTVEASVRPLSLAELAGRRVPLSHVAALLSVRAARRQGGGAAGPPADREGAPQGRMARARDGAVRVRHEALLSAARGERRSADPGVDRRQAC